MLCHECCIKIHATASFYSLEGSQEDPPVYTQGTRTYDIHYAADSELELVNYTDSDWVGDSIDQKSTSRYVFVFGGGPICWSRKKKAAIALSSAEAEYRGAVNACIQAIWLQGILSEFDLGSTLSTILFCENQSDIKISIMAKDIQWIKISVIAGNVCIYWRQVTRAEIS